MGQLSAIGVLFFFISRELIALELRDLFAEIKGVKITPRFSTRIRCIILSLYPGVKGVKIGPHSTPSRTGLKIGNRR